jgi:ubiquinone/menaquinone biosynthesis C-methylase UbiE
MSSPNYDGLEFGNKADGFDSPTKRPQNEDQRKAWQAANRRWWSDTPMRYDWRSPIAHPLHSQAYFDEIDRRFFDTTRGFMPWRTLPFDQEIPYTELPNLDVLEIGVGQGSHASLIAPRAKSFTGIDLTDFAVESTGNRLELLALPHAKVIQMDAEEMTFPDESFDYIWSWGVIHHSADTRRVLEQMHRVLRPGGRANVMVYHRSFWRYYVCNGFLKSLQLGTLWKKRPVYEVNQRATDGALARYFRKGEWDELVGDLFTVERYRVRGAKLELIPLPAGRFKEFAASMLPEAIARLFTNTLQWGSFLILRMRRK